MEKVKEITKGEWSVKHLKERQAAFVNTQYGTVCRCLGEDVASGDYLANAQLIAAAPDLLEACMQVFQQVEFYPEILGASTTEQLQRAIEKATTPSTNR